LVATARSERMRSGCPVYLGCGSVVAGRKFVGAVVAPWAVLLERPRRGAEDHAGAIANADEDVTRPLGDSGRSPTV